MLDEKACTLNILSVIYDLLPLICESGLMTWPGAILDDVL